MSLLNIIPIIVVLCGSRDSLAINHGAQARTFDSSIDAPKGLDSQGIVPTPPSTVPTPPSTVPTPPSTVPTPPSTVPTPPENPEPKPPTGKTGMELYQEQCAVCHGKQGEGTVRGYPVLNLPKAYATDIIRKGRSGSEEFSIAMPAYSRELISDYQLAEIFEGLGQIRPLESGKDFYESLCANCHGLKGEGGMSRRPIQNKLKRFEPLIRFGAGDANYLSRYQYMPRWNKIQVSDEQIQMMMDYIKGIE